MLVSNQFLQVCKISKESEGVRGKMANKLCDLFKHFMSVCVCLYLPFFRDDRRTATKFGTHIRIQGSILSKISGNRTDYQDDESGNPQFSFNFVKQVGR